MKINLFESEDFFARYEFRAKHLLCTSDCESQSIKELLSTEEQEEFLSYKLGYTEPQGSPSLRTAIQALYNRIELNEILIHTGSQEAIYTFIQSVLEPTDHVIVQTPGYESYMNICMAAGIQITEWPATFEHKWEPDTNFLADQIRKNTKAIFLTSPNNPTGFQMDRGKLNEIIQLARKANLILFSDEMYKGVEHAGTQPLPAVADLYENGISLNGTSKSLGLPGLRIGWIATTRLDIIRKMMQYKFYLSICNNGPGEYLATKALLQFNKISSKNQLIINTNLQALKVFLQNHQNLFDWVEPKAGTVTLIKIHHRPASKFCSEVLNNASILLLPSVLYNMEDSFFRIGFGRSRFMEGLQQLEEYMLQHMVTDTIKPS